jgi:hypothetical protein
MLISLVVWSVRQTALHAQQPKCAVHATQASFWWTIVAPSGLTRLLVLSVVLRQPIAVHLNRQRAKNFRWRWRK